MNIDKITEELKEECEKYHVKLTVIYLPITDAHKFVFDKCGAKTTHVFTSTELRYSSSDSILRILKHKIYDLDEFVELN